MVCKHVQSLAAAPIAMDGCLVDLSLVTLHGTCTGIGFLQCLGDCLKITVTEAKIRFEMISFGPFVPGFHEYDRGFCFRIGASRMASGR
jgi:hypothetical protein